MNDKLKRVLEVPMKTILAVRAAFDHCETVEDIHKVIRTVPPKFGEFEILVIIIYKLIRIEIIQSNLAYSFLKDLL